MFAVCVGVWAVYHPVGVGGGGENEFGLCGVVGGMTVILMLAYTMGLLRISHETADQAENRALCAGCGSAAVMSARQTYTVKHIRKGQQL